MSFEPFAGSGRLSRVALLLALLGGAVLAGCAPAPDSGSEDEQIVRLLVARGFAAAEVSFQGEEVIVEGDQVLDRAGLLAEIAEAGGDVEAVSQPAYWHRNTKGTGGAAARSTAPAALDVRFYFFPNVSEAARLAVIAALQRWNKASAGCIDLQPLAKEVPWDQHPGPLVVVAQVDLWGRDVVTGEKYDVAGRARFPIYERGRWRIGDALWIDSLLATGDDPGFLKHTAVHEVGHLLGYHHPQGLTGVTANQHLAGTRKTSTGSGYDTVMDYDGEETALTADDLLAVRKVFFRDPDGLCPGQSGPAGR